jgi:organic radical activating enzyme
MFGKNKILKPENHDGTNLDVQEIFPTIQGEGPYVGYPSVFIRLGGCNLACSFCDTEFDSYKNISLAAIISKVEELSKNQQGKLVRKLIVITGGEPLRQPIERLCEELVARNFLVQIETNGTLFRQLPQEVKIICSPKISNGKYHQIRADLLSRINAFKFIISKNQKDYSRVSEIGQLQFNIPIYVQAMDEYDVAKNQANLEFVQDLCEKEGYLLSMQIHKILDIK